LESAVHDTRRDKLSGNPNVQPLFEMKIKCVIRLGVLAALVFCGAHGTSAADAPATSEWVHPGWFGKLIYKTTPDGDRIMDFSFAGYEGGGVALPDVSAVKTIQPSGGDDTPQIQAAVDELAKLPLKNNFRGAVWLAPGDFICSNTIYLSANGIVLRGSGSGTNGTTIHMAGRRHVAITIGAGRGRRIPEQSYDNNEQMPWDAARTNNTFGSLETMITDRYVPSGATTFTVASAKGFAVGDMISIRRPTTANWIHFMGMDNLVRDGRHQTWLRPGRDEFQERKIAAIDGNKITVDIPLADSFDAACLNPPGTTVSKIPPDRRVTNVGVEHLHIQCPSLEIAYGRAPYSAVRVGGDDCWVRDVYCEETMNSTVLAGNRITMENVRVKHTFPNLGASKPTDFSIEGSQILIDRCEITGDNMYFVWTGALETGPNVILNSTFRGRGSRIQPHMRWSTGLLVDNCTVPDGGIDFPNRGVAGSGHGWTMGWAVAWNCIAKFYTIQNPPGAVNWAIGCIGDRVHAARYFDSTPILPEGIFGSYNTPVAPQSLYLAQLQKRLGKRALKKIGYDSDSLDEFTNKSVPRLPEIPSQANQMLGENLALHRPTNPSSVRDNSPEFGGENAVDGDANTYWQPAGTNDVFLEIDTEGPLNIDALSLEEAAGMTGRVQQYKVEGQVNSKWKLLSQGTSIGEFKVDHFPETTVWKVRLTILKATDTPAIREFGLYLSQ
jgi:hypothetical protein